jgi:cytoskeletal protein RodZ
MKMIRKLSKLKLIGLVAIVPILIAGTVVAYNVATPPKTVNNAHTEQAKTPSETDKQTNKSERVDVTPEDQTANESSDSTSTQTTAQVPRTTTTQPTQTATNIAPQQSATNPTPATPTCNESMKSSYTNLYNSKVNAENASWTNQINAWNDYAAGHGMAFSGYVQEQINQNKPAHDARLAQLQTQYYQNLASINCN